MKLVSSLFVVLIVLFTIAIVNGQSSTYILNKEPTNYRDYIAMITELNKQATNSNLTSDYVNNYQYFIKQGYDPQELGKAAAVGLLAQIPVVGGGISTIVDMIWSTLLSNKDDEAYKSYTSYRQMVIDYVDSQITLYDTQDTLSKLAEIKPLLDTYIRKRKEWQASKTNPDAIFNVRNAYIDLENKIRGVLLAKPPGAFRKEGFQVSELALFTQVATMHISLLKDVVKNAKAWNLTASDITYFKNAYKTFPGEYQDYAVKTYTNGLTTVLNNGIVHGQSGSELYDNVIVYKNYMTRFVFDVMALWFIQETGEPFPSGLHYDHVRYLWSKATGRLVNPQVNTPAPGGDYYNPTNVDFLRSYIAENDLYKGELINVEWVYDDNYIRGVRPLFNTPGISLPYTGAYAGVYKNTYNSKFYGPASSLRPQTDSASFDILPCKITFSEEGSTWNEFSKERSVYPPYDEVQMDWEILQYYNNHRALLSHETSFNGHRIGQVLGHFINFDFPTAQDGLFGYIRDGVLDGYYVGYLPTYVTNNNYLLPLKPTMINVQKANLLINTTAAPDFILPSVHAIKGEGPSSEFYFTVYPLDYSSNDTVYGFGVRYFYEGPAAGESPAKIKISSISMKSEEIQLYSGKLKKCDKLTYFKDFRFARPTKLGSKNIVDIVSNRNIKVQITGANVYIHSLVAYPAQRKKCNPTNCPTVTAAAMATSFYFEEVLPEDYVPQEETTI